jgi:hypothetical protein
MNIKKIKKEVSSHINNADPWFLIESGAPLDEYNSQTDRIVSLVINNKPDSVSLKKELYEIFKTKEHELDERKIQELVDILSVIVVNNTKN